MGTLRSSIVALAVFVGALAPAVPAGADDGIGPGGYRPYYPGIWQGLYVGVNARKFARAVTRQEAPQPKVILEQTVWDIADLDDYIEQQPTRDQRKAPLRLITPRI